ncbi:MAG: hypothetical protein ACJAYU_002369 [Bradymonadia bacterium]|jgi:hypothetical protein
MWSLALEALGAVGRTLLAVEPAAGDGALVRAAHRAGAEIDLTAVELDSSLLEAIREAGATAVHADSLTLARGEAPASALGAAFGAHPPSDVPERLRKSDWADLVVANPPYLRETGNRSIFGALRTWNASTFAGLYRKDCDLHHFFWDIATRWLRPGGVLVFLTPAYFLEAKSAAPLREALMQRGHVVGVWRARGDDVFPGVSVEAAVTVWRKGPNRGPCAVLDSNLKLAGSETVILRPGQPWWFTESEALADLERTELRLGDWYRVSEGVSTGANKLRAAQTHLVLGARAGEGILVLNEEEARSLESSPEYARLVHRRLRADGLPPQWVIRVRDRDLPGLDAGERPATPIESHLTRFRKVLDARAEIQRNGSRSWYAALWPRLDVSIPGAIVTQKWAARGSFRLLSSGFVPMTDYRILVPRTEQAAGLAHEVLAWLNGPEIAPWLESRMKRKGRMIEFYGECLDRVPLRIAES